MSWYNEGSQNSSGSDEGANTARRQLRARRDALRRHADEYNKRLSELKLTFEQLLHKHHLKYQEDTKSEYTQIKSHVPNSCAVCMENFKPGSKVIGLDCNPFKHVFHWKCLLSWLK